MTGLDAIVAIANWVHPQCSGINKKEFTTKIDKIIKSSKTGNNFFKCLKCSFQSATALGVDLTKIISAGKRKSVDTRLPGNFQAPLTLL